MGQAHSKVHDKDGGNRKGIKRSIRVGQWGRRKETGKKYGPSVMRTLANQHSIMAGLGGHDHDPHDKNGSGRKG